MNAHISTSEMPVRPPLAGITVLDLSRVLAGPTAGQTLADLGADVIKIERPNTGDETRGWGPPYACDAEGNATSESAYYLSANRGKKSVALDISTASGQRIVARLAEQADIVIENFKTGALAKYGLDYATLSKSNPRLIYCSITGFGQSGPMRELPGYDFLIQGMGGLMSLTGHPDGQPGGGPMKTGVAVTDIVSGLYATTAILAAIHRRTETGRGDAIDIALLDCQMAMLANPALSYLTSGVAPARQGNAHASIVPYETFETADGHVILAIGNDAQFAAFCGIAGWPDVAKDVRFATNRDRVANRDALLALIRVWMRRRTSANWLQDLATDGVPCGRVNDIARALAEPQVKARGLMLELPHPSAGHVPSIRCPIRFAEAPLAAPTAPPLLGEHTRSVLEERLGIADVEGQGNDACSATGSRRE